MNTAPRIGFPHQPFAILSAAVVLLLAGTALRAQAPATQGPTPASGAPQKPAYIPNRPSPAHPAAEPASAVPASVTPSAPQAPKWPAFEHPVPASVVWDSHGLSIDAANSSLQEILKDVSAATGVKVDGLTADQRVFGIYGPGRAGDVLSQLLQGSGYNVIMIGDQGQGAPREIRLSARQAGNAQSAARANPSANDEDNEADEQPAAQEPEPVRPGFPVGGAPRVPEMRRQELPERPGETQPAPPQPNTPQE